MAKARKMRLTDKALEWVAHAVANQLLGWTDEDGDELEPDERLTKLFDGAQERVIAGVEAAKQRLMEQVILSRKTTVDEVGAAFANVLKVHFSHDSFAKKTRESDEFAQEQALKGLTYDRDAARAKASMHEKNERAAREKADAADKQSHGLAGIIRGLAVRAGVIPSDATHLVAEIGKKANGTATDEDYKLALDPEQLGKKLDARLVELLEREQKFLAAMAPAGDRSHLSD